MSENILDYMKQLLRDEEVRKAGDGIVKLCLQVLQQYGLEGENALMRHADSEVFVMDLLRLNNRADLVCR